MNLIAVVPDATHSVVLFADRFDKEAMGLTQGAGLVHHLLEWPARTVSGIKLDYIVAIRIGPYPRQTAKWCGRHGTSVEPRLHF